MRSAAKESGADQFSTGLKTTRKRGKPVRLFTFLINKGLRSKRTIFVRNARRKESIPSIINRTPADPRCPVTRGGYLPNMRTAQLSFTDAANLWAAGTLKLHADYQP
jgi:hypothetical protein